MQLKKARASKKWSRETLAEKSGVNQSTIWRLEEGQTLPMHGTVEKLEDALGLKRGSLRFDQPESMERAS